jgi:phage tail-like protein
VVQYRQLVLRRDGNELMTSTVAGELYSIGRHTDNTLPLPDAALSDLHAEIRIVDGRALLTDQGSTSGTFIGATRLLPHQPVILTDGDVILIGAYEIVYRSQIDRVVSPSESDETSASAAEGAWPAVAGAADATDIPTVPCRRREIVLPDPRKSVSRYLQFLPVAFQKSDENGRGADDPNDFLSRFLQIFETIWEPLEQRQDHIAMFFSPRSCPASWLPWLASWVGIAVDPALPEPRARALVMNGMRIGQWRGTRKGLSLAIEVHLGLQPDIVERPDEPNVFRVRVKLPRDSADLLPALRELVQAYKPAHMGFVIEVQP